MKVTTLLKGTIALPIILAMGMSSAAEPKTWEVKVRAAYLSMADESAAFSALGIDFPADSVYVEDKWIPEIDVSYALTESLLFETVLTIPQKHDVYLHGVGKLGTLEHLPPSFSLVYEFDTGTNFTPYLSGGLNFTWITNSRLSVAGNALDLDDYSLGLAFGGGFQYPINDKWSLDAGAKWIEIDSDVTIGGAKLTKATLDPWLFSFGANCKF